nr:hypothetical protein [uncultured Mediterranean phage uvMED]
MAYIGNKPTVGNFQICDAISVVNGQAAYTMQVGSVNVIPQSANHMIVSLNSCIQKPNSSFTVSGSTITFSSNLVTGDVIDFIQILGDVLDLGVPSDATVTTAKLADDAVTAAKINNDIISGSTELATAPADTDEFLVSDAGTLKRIDYSLIKGGGAYEKISTTTVSSAVASVDFDTLSSDYRDFRFVLSGIKNANHQVGLTIRVKRAGESSYDSGGTDYRYAATGYDDSNNEQKNRSTGRDFMLLTPVGGASPSGVSFTQHSFTVDFYDVHSTDHRIFYFSQGASMEGTYGGTLVSIASGYRNTNGALIGIQFKPEAGNWSDGTFTIYGRKV